MPPTGTTQGDAGSIPRLPQERYPRLFMDVLTWLGQGKRRIALTTLTTAVAAAAVALALPDRFSARATMLPPNTQQGGTSAAAMAALGALGGLAGGLTPKTPDELYVTLLRSESVLTALDQRFELRRRYDVDSFEDLKRAVLNRTHVYADKKSGLISVEVEDREPAFAAELANAHTEELTRVLSRLAVSEAQQRRMFFEQQLQQTKERLVAAEDTFRKLQERSGLIVPEKQAEALLQGAAYLRAQIAEREVRLRVLRSVATSQNPDVVGLTAELAGLRAELGRVESADSGQRPGTSPLDFPVARLPGATIDYIRARRELKLQDTLLETMIRQFEIAKLDEAKEGPALQSVDVATPPDRKSAPRRSAIVLVAALIALVASSGWAIGRGYLTTYRVDDPTSVQAWQRMMDAWGLRRG